MASDSDKILAFVRNRLLVVGAKPERFTLTHAVTGSAGAALSSYDVEPGDVESFARKVADEVFECANSHVNTFNRIQRYTLTAWRGASAVASHAFKLRPESDYPDTEDSDPATPNGLLSQLMRHNEAMVRVTQGVLNQTMGALAKENEELRDQNRKLLRRIERDAEMREELTSLAHQRDLETAKAMADDARKTRLLQHAERFIPAIWDRIQGNDPKMLTVLNSLSEEQTVQLMGILDPGQAELIMKLVAEREAIAKATEDKGPNTGALSLVKKEG